MSAQNTDLVAARISAALDARGWSDMRPLMPDGSLGQQFDSTDVAQVIADVVRNPESVRAIRAIKVIIEAIPSDLWEEAQERDDPLWQRLDDIDAICLGAIQIDGQANG